MRRRDCGEGMRGGDCGQRDEGMELRAKRYGEGTEGEGMRGGDCGERDVGKGLWGKG